jgi:hypothetical protein
MASAAKDFQQGVGQTTEVTLTAREQVRQSFGIVNRRGAPMPSSTARQILLGDRAPANGQALMSRAGRVCKLDAMHRVLISRFRLVI